MAEPVQLLSVTSALGVIGDPGGLTGWTANRVTDGVLDVVRKALIERDQVLRELKAEAGVTQSTMSMRDRADAEAWRALGFVRDYFDDPSKARNALSRLRFEPDINPDTNAQYELSASGLGTAFHDTADRWLLTGHRPDAAHPELVPMLDQFDRWLDVHQPEPVLLEYTGINLTRGYAGRGDAVMVLDYLDLGRVPVVVDYKTTRRSFATRGTREVDTKPYSSAAVQLAAYRGFELVVRWDRSLRVEESLSSRRWYYVDDADLEVALPMPDTAGGVVIHVTPDHCTSHDVVIDEWIQETWLYDLEAARREMSPRMKNVIGPAKGAPSSPNMRTPEKEVR
jgi:hypothetical protein